MVFLQQSKHDLRQYDTDVLCHVVGLQPQMHLAAEQVLNPRAFATLDVVKWFGVFISRSFFFVAGA
jgi:hypothetical protein